MIWPSSRATKSWLISPDTPLRLEFAHDAFLGEKKERLAHQARLGPGRLDQVRLGDRALRALVGDHGLEQPRRQVVDAGLGHGATQVILDQAARRRPGQGAAAGPLQDEAEHVEGDRPHQPRQIIHLASFVQHFLALALVQLQALIEQLARLAARERIEVEPVGVAPNVRQPKSAQLVDVQVVGPQDQQEGETGDRPLGDRSKQHRQLLTPCFVLKNQAFLELVDRNQEPGRTRFLGGALQEDARVVGGWCAFIPEHARLGQCFGELGERVGIAARHDGSRRGIALRELRDEPRLEQRTLAGAREAGEIEESRVGFLQPAQGVLVGVVRAVEGGMVGFVVGAQPEGRRAAQTGLGDGDDLLPAPGLDRRHDYPGNDDRQSAEA
jgi:hypothetical protein